MDEACENFALGLHDQCCHQYCITTSCAIRDREHNVCYHFSTGQRSTSSLWLGVSPNRRCGGKDLLGGGNAVHVINTLRPRLTSCSTFECAFKTLGGEIESRLAYTQKSEGQNLPGR